MLKYQIARHIMAAILNASYQVYPDELRKNDLVKLTTNLKTVDSKIMPKGTIVEVKSVKMEKDGYGYIILLENTLDGKQVRLYYSRDEIFDHPVV